jgi:hypothetical protein
VELDAAGDLDGGRVRQAVGDRRPAGAHTGTVLDFYALNDAAAGVPGNAPFLRSGTDHGRRWQNGSSRA